MARLSTWMDLRLGHPVRGLMAYLSTPAQIEAWVKVAYRDGFSTRKLSAWRIASVTL